MSRTCTLALAGAVSATLLWSVSGHAESCAGSEFWAAESLEARDAPREAVVADFNGDGLPDIAVSKFHTNSVQVFLRQPAGTFNSQSYGTAQGVGYQPDDLVTGDVDGDSDVDLVVVNSYDQTFSVLKNGGTGLFTVTETRTLGFTGGDLALGDLDGDGDLDLVAVGSGTTKELSVFLNTSGSFTWSRDYAVAGVPRSVVLAQLDADGALDVAVASNDDGSVSVLWNTGTGSLGGPVRLAVPATPSALAAGDVDGDGRIDLLTAHGPGQVGVLVNQGGRSFAPVRVVATAVRTDTLALGDVDQDGDLDLAVTGIESSGAIEGASILLNSGTGEFAAVDRFDVGKMPIAITLGDLDGDGDSDVVVTNQSSNDVRLFLNRGARVAAAPRMALGDASGVEGIAFGDIDGDGRQDLVLAQRTQVQVARHAAGAVFAPPVAYVAGTTLRDVARGDIDGDGDVDVVVADESSDDIAVLRNTGGVLATPVRTAACDAPRAVVLADMDGDADLDVVVACFYGRVVKVLKNDGTGGFPSSLGLGFASPSSPHALAVGDMDGDGDRDFVVALNSSNLVTIGRNDGSYFVSGWSDSGCSTPESVAVADVNADGRLDIAASCRLGARVRIYLNAGGGTFTLGDTPIVVNPLTVRLADMDGDGDQDLVVVRGNTRAVAVFANDGAGHFAPSRDIAVETDAWSMDVADWDGDGDVDLATGAAGAGIATAVLGTRVGCPASAALAVAGGSVAEGNAGSSPLSFAVRLSAPVSWPVGVEYATADGTATAGSDYQAALGTLTFAPGETQKAVPVPVLGDTSIEADEAFYLDLSGASGAPLQTAQAAGTIRNDDDGRRLALDVAGVENGAGGVIVPTMGACTVDSGASLHCEYDLLVGSTIALDAQASPGSGFLGWTGACTGAGACEVVMTEARQVGASFLGPRTLSLAITSSRSGQGSLAVEPAAADGSSSCTLPPGATAVTCSLPYAPDTVVTVTPLPEPGSVLSAFGGACPTSGACTVTMSATATVSAEFEIANQAPSAHAGGPYTGVRGQAVSFSAAASSDPDGDSLTYAWDFGDGGVGDGASPTHTYSALGTFSASVTVSDGNGGSGSASATVTIENRAPVASAGGPYTGVRGQAISFSAAASGDPDGDSLTYAWDFGDGGIGSGSSPTHTYSTLGTFVVSVTTSDGNGGNATASASATISNVAPSVSLTSPAPGAQLAAPASLTLSATASDPDGSVALVEFFSNGAKIGEDTVSPYSFSWTSVPAGSYSLTAQVTDETGASTLSSPVAITVVQLGFVINDVVASEGVGTARLTVSLTAPIGTTATVQYATVAGTAGTADYTARTGTLTFLAGQTAAPIDIAIKQDSLDEPDEQLIVRLSAPSGAPILDGDGVVTIADDDPLPSITINDVTVVEGDSGSKNATFTIGLSNPSSASVTVRYATSNGTAVAPGDYTAKALTTLTFAAGTVSKSVTVAVKGDRTAEDDEQFYLDLSSPTQAALLDAQGVCTILDNEP